MIINDFEAFKKEIGKQVYTARVFRNLTQEGLARLLTNNPKADSSLISRIESGKKNLEFLTITKLAQALKIPWIFFFDSTMSLTQKEYIDKYSPEERAVIELKRIGKIAKKARLAHGKVLGDFEDGVGYGIDPSDLSKMERGVSNIRIDRIYKLSLDLKLDLFLGSPIA